MRGIRRLVLSALTVMVLIAVSPSSGFAQNRSAAPDDVPWDEIDRVLQETPRPSDAFDDAINPPQNSSDEADTEGPQAGLPAEPGNDRLAAPALAGSPVRPGMPPQSAVVKTAAATATLDTVPFDDPGDGEVAVPAASPSVAPATAPVEPPPPAVVAVYDSAKFYLPVKEYFAGKAAGSLASFDRSDRDILSQFYDARLGEPVWVSQSGFNGAADNLIAELKRANDWGLEASAYQIPALARIGSGDFSTDDLTDAELKLSLAAMAYARHARGDRIPDPTTQLSSYIDRKLNLIDRRVFLDRLTAAPDKSAYLRSTHPQHPQFELLRQKLMSLRAEPEQKPVARIARGSSVRPGKSHPHVALVRARLKVAPPGMKPDGTAAGETYYDDALAQAVLRFKEQNGLDAKPIIDNALRTALNAPKEISPSLLLTNMEQWRWMPEDLGATHVMVNIPEFMVRVMKNGSVVHAERVVTGQVSTQTPIFSDVMRTVVFQPSWNVPQSIKINELLPRLRAGGNPIAGRGLEIKRNGRSVDPWDIDWYNRDIRSYDIYQPPGPGNVLGVVKFMFPNKHSVYLHDTPSKSLFNEASRTFSHGCVRVRNPVRLAEVLMAEDKNWDSARVKDVLDSGPENNDVALDRPVPIHITYFTAWVTDAGDIRRFADVYGHEQRIKLGLAGRFDDIDKNRDHLLPTEIPVASARPRNRDFYYVDEYGNYRHARAGGGPGYYYTYGGRPPKQLAKKKPSLGNFFKQVFGAN